MSFCKTISIKDTRTKTTQIELKLIALQVNSKDVNRFQMVSLYFLCVSFILISNTLWLLSYPKRFISENHTWVKAKERNTQCRKKQILYLPLDKSILCLSGSPIFELKNNFFWLLGKNDLRIFFQLLYGYTKKLWWTFFSSQFLTHV